MMPKFAKILKTKVLKTKVMRPMTATRNQAQATRPKLPKLDIHGVLLLDKAYGISSNTALQQARRVYQAKKAGHTGILDPLASGLLPVCFGEATKFSGYLLDADKAYRAKIHFGVVRTTGDLEGDIVSERPVTFDEATLRTALAGFLGAQTQVPPMYSALKHEGRPLYEYARLGIDIPRAARDVVFYELVLLSFDGVEAEVDVLCSKGTYIRTLATDLGEKLGCGAFLSGLRRTKTAGFELAQALTFEQLQDFTPDQLKAALLPVDALLSHLPRIQLPTKTALKFLQGQAVPAPTADFADLPDAIRVRVYGVLNDSATEVFMGLADFDAAGQLFQPYRVVSCA
jgi:tRNA pseudouridine55 synthase